ncbi:MAG: hypothetical protein ACR2KL_02545 [Nocardioidaceae bacterium]
MSSPVRSRGARWLTASVLVVATALAGCSSGGGTGPGDQPSAGSCVGEHSGDVSLSSTSDHPLPGGGSAGIGTTQIDDSPPMLNLILGGASTAERAAAINLHVGDTFSLQGTSYTVLGFCADAAYLRSGG